MGEDPRITDLKNAIAELSGPVGRLRSHVEDGLTGNIEALSASDQVRDAFRKLRGAESALSLLPDEGLDEEDIAALIWATEERRVLWSSEHETPTKKMVHAARIKLRARLARLKESGE